MTTDFDILLNICDNELRKREYNGVYYAKIKENWNQLAIWMDDHDFTTLTERIGFQYCDEIIDSHIIRNDMNLKEKLLLRSIRMLTSYQKNGDFEYRTPSVEYIFDGEIGKIMQSYLQFCEKQSMNSFKTLENKRLYLFNFQLYLKHESLTLDELNVESIERFFTLEKYSLASRHNASRLLRLLFHFAYEQGKTTNDISVFVMKDNYRKNCKLPTTYEENEIREMLATVERTSSIGKRDYLVLLLAVEFGWRASDITQFCFQNIDWDKNVIRFSQHKTNIPIEFPLISSVGNAIIDYLKNGRPDTIVPQVIVSSNRGTYGQPLSSPTIHSIVTRYLRKAKVSNWETKKHGPHSLRHSLATNLLKKNISIPIISTILGHQQTETTKLYLSIDIDKLRSCPIPMPPLHSIYYKEVVNNE